MIGISTLAAAHRTLIPQLISHLETISPHRKIAVICGGVIPEQDIPALKQAGVLEVFGPGTAIPQAARKVIQLLNKQ